MGAHDEAITFAEVEEAVGGDVAEELRRVTLEIYARGAEIASARGILIADTKIELGWDASGTLTLGDEVLTPDSSRFWRAAGYQPGRPQQSLDKQFVRDFSTASGWDRMPPGPEIPDEVVAATQARYIEAYELLTGERWR
jgi:phosphoribosylaminoimidazole-succinocarboxamide synthase